MNIILVIFIFVLIWLIEGYPLLKQNQISKLGVYTVLLLGSAVLSILIASGVPIASPAKLIEKVLKPIQNILQGVLS